MAAVLSGVPICSDHLADPASPRWPKQGCDGPIRIGLHTAQVQVKHSDRAGLPHVQGQRRPQEGGNVGLCKGPTQARETQGLRDIATSVWHPSEYN